jgi:stringent starvation protein B
MAEGNHLKRRAILDALADGLTMIHLNARPPEVIVPERFKNEGHLRLNLNYKFHQIDLEVDDEAVSATLSFSGQNFRCRVPFGAIFGVTSFINGQIYLFSSDIPEDIRDEWEQLIEEELVTALQPDANATLRVYDGERPDENNGIPEPGAEVKRPALRVIQGGRSAGKP